MGGPMKDNATPQEVLNRHLDLSRSQSEQDFLECYREDSFLVMRSGVRRGIEGIRACYRQLNQELPNARYTYKAVIIEQEVGFLEWSADSETHIVSDGADSYVIRDGYIRAQTIHYTLLPKSNLRSLTEPTAARISSDESAAPVAARSADGVTRGPQIEIVVDGQPMQAFEGESVAAALLANGDRTLRMTARLHEPRGMYCGIGVCFDCVMTVDGRPNVRTCQTQVRAGMRVETQRGDGTWSAEP